MTFSGLPARGVILLLLRGGEEIKNQGREFKTYKEKEGWKRDEKEKKWKEKGKKEEKGGGKEEKKLKLVKKLVKKFCLRHTLEICYGEENSAKKISEGKEIKLQ